MLDLPLDQVVTVKLDGEPRGKGRPRFSRKMGVAFTPSETRKYESALRWAAQEAMLGRKPLECPLEVIITAAMPIPMSWPKWKQAAAINSDWLATGKPDCDNLMKMIDALNMVVWRDDSQIFEATVRKIYCDKPSLTILVIPHTQASK